MSRYLDIRLLPDAEFPTHQLLAALYAKLHRALVQLGTSRIAVVFPDYAQHPASLGARIRLMGPHEDLVRLEALEWQKGMRDHIEVGVMSDVPANAIARALRRVQAKSSPERLRRRQMRRHDLTEAEALKRVPDSAPERLGLPFVQLASASTGQVFRLYLRLSVPQASSMSGPFNTYGLSTTATVPWF